MRRSANEVSNIEPERRKTSSPYAPLHGTTKTKVDKLLGSQGSQKGWIFGPPNLVKPGSASIVTTIKAVSRVCSLASYGNSFGALVIQYCREVKRWRLVDFRPIDMFFAPPSREYPSDILAELLIQSVREREASYINLQRMENLRDAPEERMTLVQAKGVIDGAVKQAISVLAYIAVQRKLDVPLAISKNSRLVEYFEDVLKQYLPRLSSVDFSRFGRRLVSELVEKVRQGRLAVDSGLLAAKNGDLILEVRSEIKRKDLVGDREGTFRIATPL